MAHIKSLTGLRFIAAFLIFVFHWQVASGYMVPNEGLAVGVSFFFVLSGFILAYVYGGRGITVGQFYLARFARIWPVHALTAAATLALFHSSALETAQGTTIVLVNFALLQAWVPTQAFVFSLNGVAWSISAEAFFYLCFPFIIGCRHPRWLLLIVAAATFALVACSTLNGGRFQTTDIWSYSAYQFVNQFPATRLLEFVIGVLAGRFCVRHPLANASAAKASAMQAAGVAAVIGYVAVSTPVKIAAIKAGFGFPFALWFSQSGGVLIFAFVIFAFAHSQGRLAAAVSGPVMVRLGEISFAFYMVHQPLLSLATSMGLFVSVGGLFGGAIALMVSLIVAHLVWQGVEMPARRLIVGARRPRLAAP